jgi:DnaK suppressor protein
MVASLNRETLAELQGRLRRREQELLGELKSGQQRAASERFEQIAGEAPDAGDASVADVAIDSMSAERIRDSMELRDVQDALARIEAGTYGVCQECGEPIALERLRASPSARYDVQHQREQERGEVRSPTL